MLRRDVKYSADIKKRFDDIGLDVTTSMYPGLIDKLSQQYGPAGHKNPGYQSIKGRPASLPHLDRGAAQVPPRGAVE